MTEESLEERVVALEALAVDYVHRTSDTDRLTQGVERLADETGGLNSILTRVDEQQQRLTRLGRQLEVVKEESATKDDVTLTATGLTEHERYERRRQLYRVILPIIAGISLLLFCIAFAISNSSYVACLNRHESTLTTIDVLQGFKSGGPADVPLDRAIERFNATLVTSCDDQYLLHFPSNRT